MSSTGEQRHTPSQRLLFLCTGNYYRSRFAEMLFNTLAAEADLDWTATSRGIAADFGVQNVGPMSVHAVEGLMVRGIFVDEQVRFPIQLEEQDLEEADLVVALKEAEHRPLLRLRFPQWPDRVEYWHVDDLDLASPGGALGKIEMGVRDLIQRLRSNGHG